MKKIFLIPLMTLLTCVMAWGENVAKNVTTGTEYDNLKTAIGAASAGDEIQMLADLDIAAADFIKITKSLTLDMNGHYIALTATTQAAVQVNGEGIDVTIKNGTIRNAGAKYNTSSNTFGLFAYYYNSLTLDNVTITNATRGLQGVRNTTVLNNCTIDAFDSGIYMAYANATLSINGGHIEDATYGIYVTKANATLSINGGHIEGAKYGINVTTTNATNATLSINGGHIEGATYGICVTKSAADISISGDAIVGGANCAYGAYVTGTNVTINGGTIIGRSYALLCNANVTMNGGNITSSATGTAIGIYSGYTLTMHNGNISGGNIGVYARANSTFTMDGGTINASGAGVQILANSTFNLNNGEITGLLAGVDVRPGAACNIIAGNVNGNTNVIQNYGTTVISGGNLIGGATGIMAASGSTTSVDGENVNISANNGVALGYIPNNTDMDTLDCELSFHSGNISAKYAAFRVYGQPDASKQTVLKVFGGTFTLTPVNSSLKPSGIDIYGNETSSDANREAYPAIVNISGGTFSGGYTGVSLWGKGAVANISGGSIDADAFAICGNGTPQYNGTEINITGGTIGSEETALAIYHPQSGTLNIENGTLTGKNSAIEMRAGNLTITDGVFTATAQKYHCNPNGNGTTTGGAAIAIAQHTTKLPISVDIQGGSFYGVYPISQCNPQENAQEYVDLLNLVVSGGKFWATNTANVAAYTQNDKLKFRGGYYNLAPHAFVDEGYMAINNPDAAPYPTAAEGYLFKIGTFTPQADLVIQDGPWQIEDTWNDNTVPTEASNVTVAGNVTVENTEVAYAHDVTLSENATLTIKEGATLVVGDDIAVDPSAKLVVEEGGQLLIAPSDELVQPTGTVTLVADGAGVKAGKTDLTDAKNFYWQHFAIPTAEKPDAIQLFTSERAPINEAITYYNEWNITEGWEAIVKDNVTTPFVGYNFTNIRSFGSDVNYDFTGKLVGNASNPLVFTQRGFNFLGNSYLAPINIQALQTSMYEQGLEFTIYIFTKQGKKQIYRAINEVTASIYGIDEIKPMQGFFMYAQEATTADFQYNSAVYSAFINKQNAGASNNAPARNAQSAFDAKAVIAIESANGAYDEVVLVESDKYSNDYDLKADARKMDNKGLNIYADGSFDNLAVMATNDLMGQTLSIATDADAQYTISFSNVEGELALRDNATGAVVAIENGATYEFAALPNTTLAARFQIVNRFNAPTAIEHTEVKANVKGIYSITGMYLGEDFNALPAGVYVVDGVKIVK